MGSVYSYRYDKLASEWVDVDTVYEEICKHKKFFTYETLIQEYGLNRYGASNLIALLITKNILRRLTDQEYVGYPYLPRNSFAFVMTDEALASLGRKKKKENQEVQSAHEKTFYFIAREVFLLIKKGIDLSKDFSGDLSLGAILIYTNNTEYLHERDAFRSKIGAQPALSFSKEMMDEMAAFTIDDWSKVIEYVNENCNVVFTTSTHENIQYALDIHICQGDVRFVSIVCK